MRALDTRPAPAELSGLPVRYHVTVRVDGYERRWSLAHDEAMTTALRALTAGFEVTMEPVLA